MKADKTPVFRSAGLTTMPKFIVKTTLPAVFLAWLHGNPGGTGFGQNYQLTLNLESYKDDYGQA